MTDRLARLQELASADNEDDRNGNNSQQVPQDDGGESGSGTQLQNYTDKEAETDDKAMADFFARVKRVQDALNIITENTDVVEQKHRDFLVSVSKEAQDKIAAEVQNCMDAISRNANRIRAELKAIEKENKTLEQSGGLYEDGSVSTELRIRKAQHSQLTKVFVKIMTRYNDVQAENKKKLAESIRRQVQVVDPNISEEAMEQVVENGTTEGLFTGRRLADAEAALAEIQDRHKEIQALEKSLLELHEMFVDMALLVESQGEMIDRIEFAVEQSHNHVRHAVKDIVVAHQLAKKSRKKCICILILIILVLAISAAVIAGSVSGAIK